MSRKSLQSVIVVMVVILFSIGCDMLTGALQPQKMGTINIVNDHVKGSDRFPGGKNLPDYREYGVCIIVYPPVAGIIKPTFDMILARDGEETNYALPAGTYTLQEFQFDSEINQDPLYSPAMRTLVRPTEIIVLKANDKITFGSIRTLLEPGPFAAGKLINTNCGGAWQLGGLATMTPAVTFTPDPTKKAYVGGFDGVWDTNWGEMTCHVDGLTVHCEYTHDQGRIDATLSADGRTMVGQWSEYPSYAPPNDGGRVTFALSEDGNSISGDWSYGEGESAGDWTGTRK